MSQAPAEATGAKHPPLLQLGLHRLAAIRPKPNKRVTSRKVKAARTFQQSHFSRDDRGWSSPGKAIFFGPPGQQTASGFVLTSTQQGRMLITIRLRARDENFRSWNSERGLDNFDKVKD